MTREEALEFIAQSIKSDVDMTKVADALKTLEQEPCEGAVNKQVVLDMLADIDTETDGVGFYYKHYVEYIKNLPSVQPKRGHWIDEGFYAEGHSEHAFMCSKCSKHYIGYAGDFKWCPYCGSKNEVEK